MQSVLRVNYRKTGGISGLTQGGAGIANGLTGSAGAQAGGLMFFPSMSANINAASTIALSAYGLMESFYGAGIYASGYAIQPLNVNLVSISAYPMGSTLIAAVTSMHASGSFVVFTPMLSGAIPSVAVFQLLAIVISGP